MPPRGMAVRIPYFPTRLSMDFSIASILLLDGMTNGAIYALLGLATVLVFTVTRVIFIPQGEFVAYGALTLAMLQSGKTPGTVWLLLILATMASLMESLELGDTMGISRGRSNPGSSPCCFQLPLHWYPSGRPHSSFHLECRPF